MTDIAKHPSKFKQRFLSYWPYFAALAFLLFLSTDHHRIRVSVMRVLETEDSGSLYAPPPKLPREFRFESQENLRDFHWRETQQPQDLVSLLASFGKLNGSGVFNKAMPESASWILSKLGRERGHCYNDSIVFASIAQKNGFPYTRLLEFQGTDGLGGQGHSVVEVWLSDPGKWVLVDPQQVAVFTNDSGQYLSALELKLILAQDTKSFKIIQNRGFRLPDTEIPTFYRRTMQDLIYVTRNDFVTLERSIPRRIANTFESKGTSLGRPAMLTGRLFRAFFESPRYRLMDPQSSSSYQPAFWFWSLRVFLITFGICLVSRWVAIAKRG